MEAKQTQTSLPQLGEQWPGQAGVFAGITMDKTGTLYALILLDEKPSHDLVWSKALAWAKALGDDADLPNRVEGALLFANLKHLFDPTWYWLNEQYSGSDAWLQHFDYGTQANYLESAAGRARAVRRLVLDSFNPLKGAAAQAASSTAALRAAAKVIQDACDSAEAAIAEVDKVAA